MHRSLVVITFIAFSSINLGCSLFPTRLTQCSNERPCPGGQRCDESMAICVSTEDMSTEDLETGDISIADMVSNDMSSPIMLLIPGGTYTMGSLPSDSNSSPDERPTHSVTLTSFYLDITEVTQGAYRACVNAGTCTLPDDYTKTPTANWGRTGREDHPVNAIDWNQAKTYCEWRGARLPTEEEWEYAARGTTQNLYPYGNEAVTNQACVKQSNTCPVGGYGKTLFGQPDNSGLSDLLGNVAEWTSTQYCTTYDGQGCGSDYVARGYGWGNSPMVNGRAGSRSGHAMPTMRLSDHGVRCAKNFP